MSDANLDNDWNATALAACEQGKTLWTQAISRKDEGVEFYFVDKARNQQAFPDAGLAESSLEELIAKAFVGRMILKKDHPALLRLIGESRTSSEQALHQHRRHTTSNMRSMTAIFLVLCLVAHVLDLKLRHRRTIRKWCGEFGPMPPFGIGPDTLVVGYSFGPR